MNSSRPDPASQEDPTMPPYERGDQQPFVRNSGRGSSRGSRGNSLSRGSAPQSTTFRSRNSPKSHDPSRNPSKGIFEKAQEQFDIFQKTNQPKRSLADAAIAPTKDPEFSTRPAERVQGRNSRARGRRYDHGGNHIETKEANEERNKAVDDEPLLTSDRRSRKKRPIDRSSFTAGEQKKPDPKTPGDIPLDQPAGHQLKVPPTKNRRKPMSHQNNLPKRLENTSSSYQPKQRQSRSQPKHKTPHTSDQATKRQPARESNENMFEEYLPIERVQEGLKCKALFEGTFRSSRESQLGFVSIPGFRMDLLVKSKDCNRALFGDTVVVEIVKKDQLSEHRSDISSPDAARARSDENGRNSEEMEPKKEGKGTTSETEERSSADKKQSSPSPTPSPQKKTEKPVEEYYDEEGDDEYYDEEGDDEYYDEEGDDEYYDEEGDEYYDEEGDEYYDEEGDEYYDEEGDEEGDEYYDEEDTHAHKSKRDASAGSSQCGKRPKEKEQKSMQHETSNTDSKESTRMQAKVVFIRERKPKLVVGRLSSSLILNPTSRMFPKLLIDRNDPMLTNQRQKKRADANVLFVGQIDGWHRDKMHPHGRLVKKYNAEDKLDSEFQSLLDMHGIESTSPPPDSLCEGFSAEWQIPEEEIQKRKDFRSNRVFTIDTNTLHEAGNAVSIEQLDNGNYQVGVYIADLSYFIGKGSKLEEFVKERAASIHFVHLCVSMLPRLLSEHLCNFAADSDRLCIAILWEITPDGEMIPEKTWLGKGLVRSTASLSVENSLDLTMADKFDNALPTLQTHLKKAISQDIKQMVELSCKLRLKREQRGAIRSDLPTEFTFELDQESHLPVKVVKVDDSGVIHLLVKELMLLTNEAVAQRLSEEFPDAFLACCQSPPEKEELEKFMSDCAKYRPDVFAQSPPQSSANLSSVAEMLHEKINPFVAVVMSHLLMNSTRPAAYIVGNTSSSYYGLGVSLYTHFTSPLGRFADLVVHRQLSVALCDGENKKVNPYTRPDLEKIVSYCNFKTCEIDYLEEACRTLYLLSYLERYSINSEAIVLKLSKQRLSVYVPLYDIFSEIELSKDGDVLDIQFDPEINRLDLVWKGHNWDNIADEKRAKGKQQIKYLDTVGVVLNKDATTNIHARLLNPVLGY